MLVYHTSEWSECEVQGIPSWDRDGNKSFCVEMGFREGRQELGPLINGHPAHYTLQNLVILCFDCLKMCVCVLVHVCVHTCVCVFR